MLTSAQHRLPPAYCLLRSQVADGERILARRRVNATDPTSWETILMQAFTLNCGLPRRGRSAVPRRMHREERIILFRERRGNVYENKGPVWKSGNEAGMFVKTKAVTR